METASAPNPPVSKYQALPGTVERRAGVKVRYLPSRREEFALP